MNQYNSREYEIIQELQNTSSSISKLEILKNNKDNEVLQTFFKLTLSNNINFYVKKYDKDYNRPSDNPITLYEAMNAVVENVASRKLTGKAAINFVGMIRTDILPASDKDLFDRMMARKTGCGVSSKTVNKVWEDLVYIEPSMNGYPFNDKNAKNIKYPCCIQLKSDGLRFTATSSSKYGVIFKTRSGIDFEIPNSNIHNAFVYLFEDYETPMVIDGELLVWDKDFELYEERKVGNGILNSLSKGTISPDFDLNRITCMVWDIIDGDCFVPNGVDTRKYRERFSDLSDSIKNIDMFSGLPHYDKAIQIIPTFFENSIEDIHRITDVYYEMGEEGTIVKNLDSIWEDKRTKNILKLKNVDTADLKIVGFVEGNNKFTGTLGAIECETECGELKVNVGTGLTDDMRKEIWDNRETYMGKVVEVGYNALITSKSSNGNYSLFLPVFKRIRSDKHISDILENLS